MSRPFGRKYLRSPSGGATPSINTYIAGKGEKAHEKMFQGKTSLRLCLDAVDDLLAYEQSEAKSLNAKYEKYNVQQHGNRQQRRNYNKQKNRKNYNG